MAKVEKINVFILVPVGIGGKHYQANSKKSVPLNADDALFLLRRGKAVRDDKSETASKATRAE